MITGTRAAMSRWQGIRVYNHGVGTATQVSIQIDLKNNKKKISESTLRRQQTSEEGNKTW